MTALSRVGRLGLGELGFGGAQIGNLFEATSPDVAAAAVHAAWQAGVRYFDTAPHYGLGLSERRLGHALCEHPRAEFLVSTKVGRLLVPNDRAQGPDDEGFAVPATHRRVRDYSRDGVLRSIESSLERLKLDRIDIVLIHDPDDHVTEAIDQAAPALSELRDQGVVQAYGVGMSDHAILTRFVRETDLDVVMLAGRYTLLDQSAAVDLLPAALTHGVGVINAGVFNSGVLAQPRPRPGDWFDYAAAGADVTDRAMRLAEACGRFGVELPTAALAFARRHPAVVNVVVGLRTRRQVEDLVRRWAEDVPDELWDALRDSGLVPPGGSSGDEPPGAGRR
jgi:D-threo-aldose 1-dehydrogenase